MHPNDVTLSEVCDYKEHTQRRERIFSPVHTWPPQADLSPNREALQSGLGPPLIPNEPNELHKVRSHLTNSLHLGL